MEFDPLTGLPLGGMAGFGAGPVTTPSSIDEQGFGGAPVPAPITHPSQLAADPWAGGDPVAAVAAPAPPVDPLAPVPVPDAVTPVEAPTPIGSAPRAVKAGDRVSGSFKGVTAAGKRLTGGAFDQAGQKTAAAGAENDKRFGAEAERAFYTAQKAESSVMEEGRFEQEHGQRLMELEDQIRDSHETAAELERQIHADGKIEREKILGGYREQLAGVRALMQVSGNPLAHLGVGQAAAMGGAMFAQGFLAAQGIQINVAGQIDKWVDRSMAEHQQSIQNAQSAAKDQLHLYDIARQSSADDWEARERYRGFVLEGFKSAIQMEAARFGSEIAMSRAQQRAAEIQGQLDQTLSRIGDRREQAYIQRHSMNLNEAKMRMDAAHQSSMLALARQREAREAAAKTKDDIATRYLRHPGRLKRDANGKVIGMAREYALHDPKKGLEADTQKAATFYHKFVQTMDATRQLRAPAQDEFFNKFGPKLGRQMYEEAYRAFDTQRTLMTERLITYMTGAAAPEQQMDRLKNTMGDDSVFQAGGNSQNLDIVMDWAEGEYEGSMAADPNVRMLDPQERQALEQSGYYYEDVSLGGEAADSFNARFGEGSAPGAQAPASFASRRVSETTRADAMERGSQSGAYQGFVKEEYPHQQPGKGQTSGAKAVEDLLRGVVAPESLVMRSAYEGGIQDPAEIRSQSSQALQQIANGVINTDARTRAYAKRAIQMIETVEPSAILEQLNTQAEEYVPAPEPDSFGGFL